MSHYHPLIERAAARLLHIAPSAAKGGGYVLQQDMVTDTQVSLYADTQMSVYNDTQVSVDRDTRVSWFTDT